MDTHGRPQIGLVLPTFDLRQGLCGQTDPELFFPDKAGNGLIPKAKQICDACPVKAECLEWALTNREEYGIWGGLSAKERARLRGKKRADATGRPKGRPRKYKPIALNVEKR